MLKMNHSGVHSYSLIATWLILQFIFSTAGGFLSDYFSRKLILALCIAGRTVGLVLIFNDNILNAIIVDGVFGNINPVARAAYCDVHISQKRIPNIINTFFVQPIPWILFPLFGINNFTFIISVILLITSLFLVLLMFFDFRDRSVIKMSTVKRVFQSDLIMVAIAFLLLNSQWWIVANFLEEGRLFNELAINTFLINGISFFLGVFISRALLLSVEKTLTLIFFLIFSTIILKICFSIIYKESLSTSIDLMIQFTLLGGIGQPLIYALFGKKVAIHEQGTAYGLLESVQYFSEILWIGFALILGTIGLTYSYIILAIISGISLTLVWIGLRSRLKHIDN